MAFTKIFCLERSKFTLIAQVKTSYRPYRKARSEEHTSELQSRETISYAVFCLKKKKN